MITLLPENVVYKFKEDINCIITKVEINYEFYKIKTPLFSDCQTFWLLVID